MIYYLMGFTWSPNNPKFHKNIFMVPRSIAPRDHIWVNLTSMGFGYGVPIFFQFILST